MDAAERDLIARAQGRDKAAFEQLYRRYSPMVYSVALRITQNTHDAEEVTQDVFVRVNRFLGSFQFRSTFKTWLYRIAVNAALNRAQASGKERSRVIVDTEVIEETAAADAQPGDSEGVRRLLEALSPPLRAALVMREIEGLSYREIAVAQGIPLNTVRSRLKRARAGLIERFGRGGYRDAV